MFPTWWISTTLLAEFSCMTLSIWHQRLSAKLWCCLSTLGPSGGDMKHQRETHKNTLVSIIHVFQQGMPSNLWNNFPQFFVCLNSSLFPVDGLRSEKDAKSDNKLFASPFTNFQSLMLTQIVILQPEFKIYISLDWANLSPFVILPTASAKLETDWTNCILTAC